MKRKYTYLRTTTIALDEARTEEGCEEGGGRQGGRGGVGSAGGKLAGKQGRTDEGDA